MKTGSANLPLHGGKAPRWLFDRMVLLAREISSIICEEHGNIEFLNKLSDPHWFQAFGCILGFDWHSSGLTTTVCGALKAGLKPIEKDLGVFVCGGKGGTSRKTPQELTTLGEKRIVNVDPEKLIYASRMSAKVDNTALQDGYQLYQHTFICVPDGNWTVIQQGMNETTRWARRYHWLSDAVSDFVCEPHKAICCDHKNASLNMTAKESTVSRDICAEISRISPDKTIKEYEKIQKLSLKSHHDVRTSDIKPKNLHKILLSTYTKGPKDFEQLLGTPGVGPKSIRALAMISELIYGEKPSFKDPVRFSFAHGGKDGFPYPVNRKVYDHSIDFLKKALNRSKIGAPERVKAFRRLHKYLGA